MSKEYDQVKMPQYDIVWIMKRSLLETQIKANVMHHFSSNKFARNLEWYREYFSVGEGLRKWVCLYNAGGWYAAWIQLTIAINV